MRLKTALTKKDIVVLVCLIFLMINVGAISSGGRSLFHAVQALGG